MKTFEQFENKNTVDLKVFDELISKLNTSHSDHNQKYKFSSFLYQPNSKDQPKILYELIAEEGLGGGYTKIEEFMEKSSKLIIFFKDNFNYHDTKVSCFSRNSSIAFTIVMTDEELIKSKLYKSLIGISKYNL